LEGTCVPKPKDQLAKDVSGYFKFWNIEHCKVLQFLPTATKERRNFVVNYRWNMQQTPQTVDAKRSMPTRSTTKCYSKATKSQVGRHSLRSQTGLAI
jgi:predicted alpha-1,6-mannanase (GH76 family)